MSILGVLVFIVIGAVAGWSAGKLTKGHGFGLAGNIIVGIVGAVLGGALFRLLGLTAGGFIGSGSQSSK